MTKEYLISITQFCTHHQVEVTFINTLKDYGLIELIDENDDYFVHQDQLPRLEKITRLHHEMDINLEGIEVIIRLLNQVEEMHNEVISLKNRLRLYE